MTSTVKRLLREELERVEQGDKARAKKGRKGKREAFQLAEEAVTEGQERRRGKRRAEEALRALLDADQAARVDKGVARAVAGYGRRQRAKKEAEEGGKKKKTKKEKEGGAVFTDEDFEKWSKAYFINSKLDA